MCQPTLPVPQAEVWGGALLGAAEGLAATGVPWCGVLQLLEEAGLGPPRAEACFPLEPNLAFHAAVERVHGREALRAMGRVVTDTARCAPDRDSLDRLADQYGGLGAQVSHRPGADCRWLGAKACVFDLRW